MLKSYGRKKRMKRMSIAIFTISILLYFSLLLLNNFSNNSKVISKIDSTRIYEDDIKRKFIQIFNHEIDDKNFDIAKISPEIIKSLSKEIYLEQEILKIAKKSGIHRNLEVKDEIKRSEDDIIVKSYLDRLIVDNTTDQKINAKYLQVTTDMNGKREYKISRLAIDSEKTADEIFNALNKVSAKYMNYKFNYLYKKYSLNHPESFKGRYIIETLIPSDILSEFDNGKVVAMRKEGGNFYIFKVTGAPRAVEIPKLDESYKEEIKGLLVKGVMQRFIEKSVKDKEVEILDNLK